jgi:AAA domain
MTETFTKTVDIEDAEYWEKDDPEAPPLGVDPTHFPAAVKTHEATAAGAESSQTPTTEPPTQEAAREEEEEEEELSYFPPFLRGARKERSVSGRLNNNPAADNHPVVIPPGGGNGADPTVPSFSPHLGEKERKKERSVRGRLGSELLLETPEALDWVLTDFFLPGALTLLYGQYKSGKTTFLIAALAAVTDGETFLDRETKPTTALLLTEMGDAALRPHVERMDSPEKVRIISYREAKELTWEETIDLAIETCLAEERGILIIDSFGKWSAGIEENDQRAVYKALEHIDRAKEAGLAVVLVHHSRKGGDTFRGSTALGAEPDILVGLSKRDRDYTARVLKIESWYDSDQSLLVERDEEDGSFSFVSDVTRKKKGKKDRAAEDRALILSALGSDRLTTAELQERVSKSRTWLDHRLPNLVEDGVLIRETVPGRGGANAYRLATQLEVAA